MYCIFLNVFVFFPPFHPPLNCTWHSIVSNMQSISLVGKQIAPMLLCKKIQDLLPTIPVFILTTPCSYSLSVLSSEFSLNLRNCLITARWSRKSRQFRFTQHPYLPWNPLSNQKSRSVVLIKECSLKAGKRVYTPRTCECITIFFRHNWVNSKDHDSPLIQNWKRRLWIPMSYYLINKDPSGILRKYRRTLLFSTNQGFFYPMKHFERNQLFRTMNHHSSISFEVSKAQ